MVSKSTVDFNEIFQHSLSYSSQDIVQCRSLWIIPDYFKMEKSVKAKEYIECKTELSIFPQKFNIILRLYPKGDEGESKDCSLYMHPVDWSDDMEHYHLCFHFAVVNMQGLFAYSLNSDILKMLGSGWGYGSFFPIGFTGKESPLVNGALQILINITAWPKKCVSEGKNSWNLLTKKSISSTADLLFSGKYSDLTVFVEETNFKVHKSILASKSNVFDEIFNNSSNNAITLDHITSDVFREVLNFIFTDFVTAMLLSLMPDVLRSADKYELDYLKEICQTEMLRTLSLENAVEYYRVSSEVNAIELKEKSMSFIISNGSQTQKQEEWKKFKLGRSEALMELLDKMMENINVQIATM